MLTASVCVAVGTRDDVGVGEVFDGFEQGAVFELLLVVVGLFALCFDAFTDVVEA